MGAAAHDVDRTLTSTNPATGETVGTLPLAGDEAVREAVARARVAGQWWADLGFVERRRRLLAWKGSIARRAEELCDLIHRENGKPRADAMIEVLLTCEHLDWAARRAKKVLSSSRVPSGLLALHQRAWVDYPPLGVVGVISPWNFPLFVPMQALSSALAAGNAVVHKPSEHTSMVASWLAEAFAMTAGEQPVLQPVFGFAETGAALCAAGVDKVAVTGSAATGRQVMAACAQTLTPVVAELGGMDAIIVDGDADVPRAARSAVWAAISNAGQTCIGVERAYVVEAAYDEFVAAAAHSASRLRAGDDAEADLGPMTVPEQVEIVREHLADAFARGAKALVGGPDAVRPPYVDPVVLVDVPAQARILNEETFGPVLPIERVRDADEAVARTNSAPGNLGVNVWGRRRAVEIAQRVGSGMAAINGVMSYVLVPSLPFGGNGESGFGRLQGPDGLREFTRARATAQQRFTLPFDMTAFERPDGVLETLAKANRLRHGRR
jgi:acyl-CoA reductase-like NAD-dependent aldehyde dehydrogenase